MFEAFLVFFDPLLRLGVFAGALAAMAAWEALAPCRALRWPKARRWTVHFALLALDLVLVRLLFPAGSVVVAAFAAGHGWGLFGQLELPPGIEIAAAVIVLDLVLYAQHVLAHAVPLLWRIHRVHHGDPDFDLSTGIRFHPAEALLVVVVRYAAIAALGPPLAAVVLFELLLAASTLFIHGNVRLPGALERVLRRVIVTPDMHRVHHSAHRPETNSNYGQILSSWDRLFGTYCEKARGALARLRLGLDDLGPPASHLRLGTILALPVREWTGSAAGNRPGRRV